MSVDVVDQLRRLVESFDEFVDDVSTDEVVQRVGGSAHSAPSALDRDDRSGWRPFSLVAAAVLLVGGLVAALVWVGADRASPPSNTPPPVTQDTTATASLGEFVWPVPPRGYTSVDDLIAAFTTEVMAWGPSDIRRVGDTNDQPQPQAVRLVNERVGANVLVVAIPSPAGWGFVQIGDGLSASVDEGETVVLQFASTPGTKSSAVEARLSDGTTIAATATPTGRAELPRSVRLDELVSVLVVEFDEEGNSIGATGVAFSANDPATQPSLPPPATAASDFAAADVVGTWVVTRRGQNVDDAGSQMFVPLASPLPNYRFEADGTVSGFDGCNSAVARWSFTEGEFTTSELTNGTAAMSTIGCEDSNGDPLPTVGPAPERLELIDGTITMVFDGEDGMTAHAQRVSDLPTPRGLAGSSWILAVDGPDITVNFGRDGTVEFRDDTTTCAAGSYTYDAGVLVLDLDATPDGCPGARLEELTRSPLEVASFSDDYMADTILLVPATGGAVRLFPESASTEETAGVDSGDSSTANTGDTIPGG